ncbi:MAG: DUF6882 domain-containing protein [Gemmatimonadaceae bacterium]
MFGQKKGDASADVDKLSPEADTFLAEATKEFNAKQDLLTKEWRFDSFDQWSYDAEHGVLKLGFSDGKSLVAEGQLLGTFSVSDSSFEWAWNSPHFNDTITRDSKLVKGVGKKLAISYTQVGMIPIPGEAFLSYICAIGLKASESLGMFRGTEDVVHPLIMIKNPRWL